MRSLLQFIGRHFNFLLLLLLEIVAFVLMATMQPFRQAAFLTSANRLVARINSVASDVTAYFSLRTQNEELARENADLRFALETLRNRIEPLEEDSSLYQYAHLMNDYIPARVVDLTTDRPHNHLTLNKGLRDGIRPGQGVISAEGVVGTVSAVSEYYALVVPLIHTQTRISCRILPSGSTCFTSWNGVSDRYAALEDVARHVSIAVGDTVVTSGLGGIFEENTPVGIVEQAELGEHDSYYRVRIRLTTDFRHLRYVQIISNPTIEEIREIEHASI